ncbi:metallophosphoesterase family protein [Nonlabens ponticola]|uniref:Serine/threonine protein phosphatase n=1 Tax=Nonlabens ponticola TaxID=2496866 RepID=A0A3S9MW47_9FLAO|nr:metallophosphoesterase family protein [Nonlabens ponticola]AZQ43343.1 serine/threonine protein phosphatase [Nonlabens ponticola]
MRTIVIGDIHGAHRALTQLLDRLQPQPDDCLIFLGDYVDGWSQSYEVLEFLITLSRKRKQQNHTAPIYLRGNHDELVLNFLVKDERNEQWLHHGGTSTVESYANRSDADRARHVAFLIDELLDFLELDGNGFFHAGFHNLHGPHYEYYKNLPYWDRTLWEMALCIDPNMSPDNDRYPNRLKMYKEIFIGHTPTTRLGEMKPIHAANVWNVDTGAAFLGPLTAMCIETKEIWQSDPVHTLYPNEDGRN